MLKMTAIIVSSDKRICQHWQGQGRKRERLSFFLSFFLSVVVSCVVLCVKFLPPFSETPQETQTQMQTQGENAVYYVGHHDLTCMIADPALHCPSILPCLSLLPVPSSKRQTPKPAMAFPNVTLSAEMIVSSHLSHH
jgi:hypothetical protein